MFKFVRNSIDRLIAEKAKFNISWRLSISSSLIYIALSWGYISTLQQSSDLNNPLNYISILIASLFGSFFGLSFATGLEILLFKRIFRKWSYRSATFVKSILTSTLVFFLVLCSVKLYLLLFKQLPFLTQLIPLNIWDLMQLPLFWGIVLYWGAIIDLNFFMNGVHTLTGNTVFSQYSLGKYYKPIKEERVFLFLDMDKSTNIAERIGDEAYFNLLNEIYNEFSFPIEANKAEIYQYIGDEIVMSWDIKTGTDQNRCVSLFFELTKILDNQSTHYKNKYGVTPTFKAALHSGQITTGEVGYVRTAILHSGDVVNTTARLEKLSGTLKQKLLVTKILFDQLNKDKLVYEDLGDFELSGKRNKTRVYSIKEIKA